MKTQEFDFRVVRPTGQISWHGVAPYQYRGGVVFTALGLVSVYAQGGRAQSHSTSLTFIYNGRAYVRTQNRALTNRGMVTAADRFAREIAEVKP